MLPCDHPRHIKSNKDQAMTTYLLQTIQHTKCDKTSPYIALWIPTIWESQQPHERMPRSQTSKANCPFIGACLNHNILPNFAARHTQRRASPGYARNKNKLDKHRKTTPTMHLQWTMQRTKATALLLILLTSHP